MPVAERAADALADEASVEILDLRSLRPLDEEALLASAAKTGRVVVVQEAPRTCGFAAEVAAILAEKAILDLRGPVLRVTGYDVPYPYWQLEDYYMPSTARVVDAARRLLALLVANHELPLDPANLHGYFSRELEPVLAVEPGDSVRIAVPNAGWEVAPGRAGGVARPELDTGHALAGPIEVRGARAGQTLAVRIDDVTPGRVGRHAHGAAAPDRLGARGRVRTRGGTYRRAGAVPRRPGNAAGGAGHPLDDPAAALRRQHRLQGAGGRDDALPPDSGRRGALLGR